MSTATAPHTQTAQDRLQQIDAEVAQWHDRLADLEHRREQARRRVETVTQERDRQALSAHLGDAQAKKSLADTRKSLFEAMQDAEELGVATAAAQTTLASLLDARILAEEAAKRQERAALATANHARAEQIDRLLDQVVDLARLWIKDGLTVYNLSAALRAGVGRTPRQMVESAVEHHFNKIVDLGRPVFDAPLAAQSPTFKKEE